MQVGLLVATWWACDSLAHLLDLPVPGSVLALALLISLLLSRQVKITSVRRGANGLLDHMILFFVPAIMALLNHREFLGLLGLKILLVILVSTLMVMVGTALAVDAWFLVKARDAQ
jgi:holin-like protein